MGIYVDERYITEEIVQAWTGRQLYDNGMPGERPRLRSLERMLGDQLFTMKAALTHAGRAYEWRQFLKVLKIPVKIAEQLVGRCKRRLRRKQSAHCTC